jgi:hypothetical protein
MAESSGGLRLDAVVRKGACGTWWAASTADGRTRGLLQLDPALTADPAAVERAAEKVAAVRALNLPGVLRTTDLVADAGRVWLVAAAPPVPVFTDLAATGLDPAAAAFLALDVGNALVGLHSAGLCHGALGPETVAVTAAGFAMLTEVGLRPALTGSTRDAAADARAWCRLVRVLAGNPGDEAATRAFAEAAGLVELGGVVALESALRRADGDRVRLRRLPQPYQPRDGRAARHWRRPPPARRGPRRQRAPAQAAGDGPARGGRRSRCSRGPSSVAGPRPPPECPCRQRRRRRNRGR